MSIKEYIQNSIDVKKEILNDDKIIQTIQNIAEQIISSYKNDKKVLLAGNGGSAGDAQHIAGELVCRFNFDRKPLSAFALSTDTSVLTAIANDYGYDEIFSRQILANGNAGDIFIAISTSGKSNNIVKAIQEAKNKNLIVVLFTGDYTIEAEKHCDYILKVPSKKTSIIQESHIMIGHIICGLVEKELCIK